MGGGKSVQAPAMTLEEKLLIQKQTEAADVGLDILKDQVNLADAALPSLYETAGVEPVFRDEASVNDEIAGLESQLKSLRGQQFTTTTTPGGQVFTPFQGGRYNPGGTSGRTITTENPEISNEIRAIQDKISGLRRAGTQEILRFNKIADPTQAGREAVETGFLDRTLAALEGNLEVNPALLRDLETEERKLENVLRSRLGTGFETSTAGIQALDEFRQTKLGALETARRADLSQAFEGMVASRGFNESIKDTFMQRLGAATQFKNPLIGATSAVGANFASPAASFAQQRELETNVALQNQANSGSGFLGSVVGGLAGSFFGPVGTALGSRIGGSIFSEGGHSARVI